MPGTPDADAWITAFTVTIKIFCLWYGQMLLFAIGLTPWIEHAMANRRRA